MNFSRNLRAAQPDIHRGLRAENPSLKSASRRTDNFGCNENWGTQIADETAKFFITRQVSENLNTQQTR